MNPEQDNNTQPTSEPAPSPQAPPTFASNPEPNSDPIPTPNPFASQPPKKNNKTVIALVCVLLVLALGIGAYFLFFNKPNSATTNQSQNTTELGTQNPANDPPQDTPSDEETEITDQDLLADLNRKISILTGISNTSLDSGRLLNSALAYNEVENFYSRGFQSVDEKAGAVLIGSKSLFTFVSAQDYESRNDAINDYVKANYDQYVGFNDGYNYIAYDTANEIYSSMFNETLPKQNIETNICAREYVYVETADAFLEALGGGCGGTGYSGIIVRKDSYKAKDNEAYVYAKIASTHIKNGEGWRVYDDFYALKYGDDTSNLTVIDDGTLNIYNGVFQEMPSDYSFMDAAHDYRFVFKESASGTYYFNKLEKL
ncbi:hypothetical protein IJG96_01030 [Candidatus Saccharibacteria bacterium]|nr:hypothetical protein [Candidatus Saccharibacteria bacterium]